MVAAVCCAAWLCPAVAAAQTAPAPIDRWFAAELFREEYGQDLAAALAEATTAVAVAAAGEDRAAALLYEARIRRLRGELRTADERLARAEAEAGAITSLRYLVRSERRVVELDRYTTPWGTAVLTADDVMCTRPDLETAGQRYRDELRVLSRALPSAADPLAARLITQSLAIDAWVEGVDSLAMARNFVGQGSRIRDPDAPPLATWLDTLTSAVDSVVQFAAPLLPDGRAARARRRLALAGVATSGDAGAIAHALACEALPAAGAAVDVDAAHALLACAEAALFTGGTPEDLGRWIEAPRRSETTWVLASGLWTGAEVAPARLASPTEALAWLDAAERGFTTARHTRGAARTAWVRAAERVAAQVTGAAPGAAARQALVRAIDAARHAGDLSLVHHGEVLAAASWALDHDRPAARAALAPVLAALDGEGAIGAGLGAARLLAQLASQQAFVRFDVGAAEILDELALRVYERTAAPIEGAHLQMRRVGTYLSVGAAGLAEDAIATGVRLLGSACPDAPPLGATTLLGEMLGEMWSLHVELKDQAALARDLDALARHRARLGGGDDDPARVLARLLDAQAEKRAADQALFAHGVGVPAGTSPADVAARRAAHLALRRRSEAASQRVLQLSHVFGTHEVQAMRRFMTLHGLDRQDIVRDPDLPPDRWYRRSEDAAQDPRWPGAWRGRAMIEVLRRRPAAARAAAAHQPRDPGLRREVEKIAAAAGADLAVLGRRVVLDEILGDAGMLVEIGDFAGARARMREVEARMASPTWYLQQQAPWHELARYVRIASGLGEHEAALGHAREMLRLVEARRVAIFDERFRATIFDSTRTNTIYEAAVQAAVAAAQPAVAMGFIERSKARALQERLAADASPTSTRLRELAQGLLLLEGLHQPGRCGAAGSCARLAAALAARRAEYERLLARSGFDAAGPADADAHAQVLARTQARLPAGAVLLDFYAAFEGVVVVAVAPGRAPIVAQVPIAPPVLEGRVRRLSLALVRGLDDPSIERDAGALAEVLFAPAVRELLGAPGVTELVLVPHGVLHQIPFAFLPLDGRRLVERFAIRVLPYADLLARPASATAGTGAAVLVHDGDDPARALTHAFLEGAQIARGHGVSPRRGATRADLFDALTRRRIVHVVAHALSPLRRDQAARIDLRRTATDDGDVLVSDLVFHERPFSADVVVLSSCELALGRRSPSDEGSGVPRALLQKGAGTVIAPLWRLADSAPVLALMSDLHAALRRGDPPAPALAAAQRAAIARGTSPADWAGFIALGGSR